MIGITHPWSIVSMLVAAALGGTLGWFITSAGCGADGCPLSAGLVAVAVGVLVAAGAGVVVSLAVRSQREHEAARSRGGDPPEAGCEVPESEIP